LCSFVLGCSGLFALSMVVYMGLEQKQTARADYERRKAAGTRQSH